MRAAVVAGPGQPPAYAHFDDPEPAAGEVAVTVAASALSPLARMRASGAHYTSAGAFPFVAGVDGVGRLDDGRPVYFLLPRAPFGGMAERTVVADGHWIALPDGLDPALAAVIANPGMSSWAALIERARIAGGETVLVNGATGASGQLAVRIARHLGAARVIATGRNRAVLDGLGTDATLAINGDGGLPEDDLREHFAAGVDIVLDYLWGPSARTILATAAQYGPAGVPARFVQIGSAGGAEIGLPAAILRSSAIEMKGSGLGSVALPRLLAAIGGVLAATRTADLSLPYRTVPLADVAATWADGGSRIVYVTD